MLYRGFVKQSVESDGDGCFGRRKVSLMMVFLLQYDTEQSRCSLLDGESFIGKVQCNMPIGRRMFRCWNNENIERGGGGNKETDWSSSKGPRPYAELAPSMNK